MLECRSRGAVALIAEESAVAPWAIRAAELFGVDMIRLTVGEPEFVDATPRIAVRLPGGELSRDAAVVALADRVDTLFVRSGGKIFDCVKNRVLTLCDASTRVAVTNTKASAARRLIQYGAIGWFVSADRHQRDRPPSTGSWAEQAPAVDPSWVRSDGEWLVHCTRTCVGPWPGQTQHQYQDALLLGEQPPQQRTPLDTLRQILRSGRLVATAIASAKAWPVVCFSAAPLRELLDRRCFRPHLKRWDYEPYGVAIRKSAAARRGIQPVIYGEPEQRQQFADAEQFRFQAVGKTYDWRIEREWRAAGDIDLHRFPARDLKVFVPSAHEAGILAPQAAWTVDVVSLSPKSPQRAVVR
jgi:hypothetical protein